MNEAIRENAKYILKGYSIPAKCYNSKPNGMTQYIRNGRAYYIDNELAHYISKAGYIAA